ncbi:hypothetical protein [Methyloversatilis sp.]|uniref:hypothetical protein n=1 Tax=Methyloversatilis sp. TaxID=2569862 RepID=UPI003F700B9C
MAAPVVNVKTAANSQSARRTAGLATAHRRFGKRRRQEMNAGHRAMQMDERFIGRQFVRGTCRHCQRNLRRLCRGRRLVCTRHARQARTAEGTHSGEKQTRDSSVLHD